MSEQELQRLYAIIQGRVQGVNFRSATRRTAHEIDVTGFVRNLPDGTVEVSAEGTRFQLERLLDFLHVGPVPAQVTAVSVEWSAATNEYDTFTML